MKSKVSLVYLASALLSTAALLNGADLNPTQPGGFTVHEWGTFTSVAGEDGSAIEWDVLGGKDDLPSFVNHRGFRCFKFRLSGTVRMETPVLYFYSPQELEAHVRVAFPRGLITEWYPQADYQVDQQNRANGSTYRLESNLNGIDTSMRTLTGGIEWKSVKIEPNDTAAFPRESSPSRYYAARATDAAAVTAAGQHEKFLFYRGVGKFAVPLSGRPLADGTVVVENLGPDPVPMVMLFTNRGGRFGYRRADSVSGSITLDPPALDGTLPKLRADLENALVEQGLFRKEAQAMVETWRDSWFEEGTRLVYLVPSGTVDAVLPLQVTPVPMQTTRVFVGRIELITPETMHMVDDAVTANDSSIVARYGRFLDPILQRIATQNPAREKQIQQFRAKLANASLAASCK